MWGGLWIVPFQQRDAVIMSDKEDESLVSASHRFTELWLRSCDALGGFIFVHIHDHALAEDVLQEVAKQATAKFAEYDPSRPFIAWLIGIARRRIADVYREQGRNPITFSSDAVESLAQAGVKVASEMEDRIEGLRLCMEKLSHRHRRVIEMRYSRKMSQQEIGDQVGSSARAVNMMLCRIRSALRECVSRYVEGMR